MAESLWTGVASTYARSFAGLCAGAIPVLLDGLPHGGRLLDVGCGTGALVRTARAAGIDAIGVEPDPEMAALAGSTLGEEVAVGGLPDLSYAADGFDVVIAGFVLNHVDDPRAGARELARVAAPGGVVRATIWGRVPAPGAALWSDLLDAVAAERPAPLRLPPDLDFDRSPEGLAGMLAEAGLALTSAGTSSWQWRVGADDLWAGLTSIGGSGVLWRAQSPQVQSRLREAYDEVRAPWRDGDDFIFEAECVVAEAHVPRS